MENKFEQLDNEGRIIFQEYCEAQPWCKFIKTSKPNDVWDVSYFSGGTMIIGEIKKRGFTSDKFTDWMIHQHKIDSIETVRQKVIAKYQDIDTKIASQFINLYTDDVVRIWDITDYQGVGVELLVDDTFVNTKSQKIKTTLFLKNSESLLTDHLDWDKFVGIPINNETDQSLPF